MQRVDDVTGETIRLTAHQKELRVESMIARINELTRQVNHLTTQQQVLIEKHNQVQDIVQGRDTAHSYNSLVAKTDQHRLELTGLHSRVNELYRWKGFFTHLRWLLTGR
jgi:uncharacterized protein YoxC